VTVRAGPLFLGGQLLGFSVDEGLLLHLHHVLLVLPEEVRVVLGAVLADELYVLVIDLVVESVGHLQICKV
jgi:hypothetical protein